jgi:hypothetical protein
MAEVINLRRAAKTLARQKREQLAQANREKFGQTKAQKQLARKTTALQDATLDGARLSGKIKTPDSTGD